MKKLLLLFYITSISTVLHSQSSFTFKLQNGDRPLANYPVTLLTDTENPKSPENIKYHTDGDGSVSLPVPDGIGIKELEVLFPSLSNPPQSFHIIDGSIIEGLNAIAVNLVDTIPYIIKDSTLTWNSIADADYYLLEAYDCDLEIPDSTASGSTILLGEDFESQEVQRLQLLNSFFGEEDRIFRLRSREKIYSIPAHQLIAENRFFLISAYNKRDVLLAQSQPFNLTQGCILTEDQIQLQFRAYGLVVSDVDFEICTKDEEGKFVVLENCNTGTTTRYRINRKPEWPENLWIRFNVMGVDSDGNPLTRNLELNEHWGRVLRFNKQYHIPLWRTDNGLKWKTVYRGERYELSIYRYTGNKTSRNPLLVEYDSVQSESESFRKRTRDEFSWLVDLNSPSYQQSFTQDTVEISWPEELPSLNLYAMILRVYDENGNIIAISSLSPWPKESPVMTVEEGGYNKEAAAVALSAIMMEINNHNYDSLPIYPADKGDEESVINDILSRDWGINNREDLIASIEYMREASSSKSMERVMAALEGDDSVPLWERAYRQDLSLNNHRRLYALISHPGYFDHRLQNAWDWGRGVSLVRWGYTAGYITEEESWGYLDDFLQKIRKDYKSWEDFGQFYVLGRYYWSLYKKDNEKLTRQALETYKTIMARTGTPWQGTWNPDLPTLEVPELDIDPLFRLTSKEILYSWALEANRVLRNHPEEADNLIFTAPPGWQKEPRIILLFLEALERAEEFGRVYEYREDLLKAYPRYIPFYQLLARCIEETDGADEALAVMNSMVEEDRSTMVNSYLRGRLFFLTGKDEEALQLLTEVTGRSDSRDWFFRHASYISGRIYFNRRQYHDAGDSFRQALEADRENCAYQYFYAVSLLYGNYSDAELIESLLRSSEKQITVPEKVWDDLNELKSRTGPVPL